MVAVVLSRLTILIFGILYPAYASFKAVRRKSHREYVKWMMYWIVFALFTSVEMITDTFLPWLPLYYEVKILFVLWLVLPITEGSKQLYRIIVHPFLLKHENRIDDGISQAGQAGLRAFRRLSTAGLNKAATTVLSSAIKGQAVLAETLLRAQEQGQPTSDNNNAQDQDQADGSSAPSLPQAPHPSTSGATLSRENRGSTSTSSSDLEPFEVIDEQPEDVYHESPGTSETHEDLDFLRERVDSTTSSLDGDSTNLRFQDSDTDYAGVQRRKFTT